MASLATEVQILEEHVDSHDGTFILARIKLEILRQIKEENREKRGFTWAEKVGEGV